MKCAHATCYGPVCTQSSGPHRPDKPAVAARKALLEAIKTEAKRNYGQITKEASTGLTVLFTYVNEATGYVSKVYQLAGSYVSKVAMVSDKNHYGFYVRIRLKKSV